MAKVNQWNMDEASNTTLVDSITGNNLTVNATGSELGRFQNSIRYNTNAYARRTSHTLPANLTLNMWVWLDDTSNTQWLFKIDGSNPALYVVMRSNDNTNLEIYYNNSSGNRYANIPRSALPTNSWFMLTITTQSSGVLKSYLNGRLYATSGSTGSGSNNAQNMNVGGYDTGTGNNPHGKFDKVNIFDTVLADADILNMYFAGIGIY